MQFIYIFCNGNGEGALVEYRQRYPLCRIPHHKTCKNVHRTLREIDSFPWANAECEQWQCGDDILAAVQRSLGTGTHWISRMAGVAQTQVWRILHHDYLYPYHLQRVQFLLFGDFVNGCNHSSTFCSLMKLNLHGMILPTQGIFTLWCMKIYVR
jgi:hypothetical protein